MDNISITLEYNPMDLCNQILDKIRGICKLDKNIEEGEVLKRFNLSNNKYYIIVNVDNGISFNNLFIISKFCLKNLKVVICSELPYRDVKIELEKAIPAKFNSLNVMLKFFDVIIVN